MLIFSRQTSQTSRVFEKLTDIHIFLPVSLIKHCIFHGTTNGTTNLNDYDYDYDYDYEMLLLRHKEIQYNMS